MAASVALSAKQTSGAYKQKVYGDGATRLWVSDQSAHGLHCQLSHLPYHVSKVFLKPTEEYMVFRRPEVKVGKGLKNRQTKQSQT